MSDACDRCKGHGKVPKTPGGPYGDNDMVPCRVCGGSGRRGPRPE